MATISKQHFYEWKLMYFDLNFTEGSEGWMDKNSSLIRLMPGAEQATSYKLIQSTNTYMYNQGSMCWRISTLYRSFMWEEQQLCVSAEDFIPILPAAFDWWSPLGSSSSLSTCKPRVITCDRHANIMAGASDKCRNSLTAHYTYFLYYLVEINEKLNNWADDLVIEILGLMTKNHNLALISVVV